MVLVQGGGKGFRPRLQTRSRTRLPRGEGLRRRPVEGLLQEAAHELEVVDRDAVQRRRVIGRARRRVVGRVRAGHGQAPAEAVVLGERGRQLLLQGRDEAPLLPVPRGAEPVPLHARALARLALLHGRAVAFLAHLLLSPVYEWLVRENARFCALFQAQREVKSWV